MQTELQPFDVSHVAALRELRAQPGVVRWWGPVERGFPFDEPESQRFAIVADGDVSGMVQVGEENWPEGRHGWIDIFVGDDFAGRGIGTAAVRDALQLLLARGHHRVTIDPNAANAAAIRCYEKAGFTRVGVTRASWRKPGGEWSDELLMEFVAL